MIISHKHKFIFLKSEKTASTSIETSLGRYCGEIDIITPIVDEDEGYRGTIGVKSRNYHYSPWEIDFLETIVSICKLKKPDLIKYHPHTDAKTVKELIGERIWNSYYKFCFVRNPYDEFLSRYYWRTNYLGQNSDFQDLIDEKVLLRNRRYYRIEGEIVLDYIGKFENLHEDLIKICNYLEIPFDKWIPKLNNRTRPRKNSITAEQLPQNIIDQIIIQVQSELKYFNYQMK